MAAHPAYMLSGVAVVQPPHLEGDPLFATEILPGPPPLASIQQPVPKRDPRKPAVVLSYLPSSDPGSTYPALATGPLGGGLDESHRKRARADKGSSSGRALRASARNLSGTQVSPEPPLLMDASISGAPQPTDVDPTKLPSDAEETSNLGLNMPESNITGVDGNSLTVRKDKGKGKETSTRVKEEPLGFLLHQSEPVPSLSNDDHCSACRSQGTLVYCDGCPRAFHIWCLDPPMEPDDVPEADARWFCPSCAIRKNAPRRHTASFMAPLITQLQTSLPSEYHLPDEIRNFFKDVATGPKGTYVDSSEIKPPRLNRHGQLEDRDPYRLKDRNGAPLLCFRCGLSALPGGMAVATQGQQATLGPSNPPALDAWKSIVSCDYCSLHWHLDCLDPPLPSMPPEGKRWMCSNHVDKLLQPKRRVPKHNAPSIEITKLNQCNNGNIEISHPEAASQSMNKEAVDEVLINGRRYRIPERVVLLDFWNKIGGEHGGGDSSMTTTSEASSPLTSLSSLEEEFVTLPHKDLSLDDLRTAALLCNFHKNEMPKSIVQKATVSVGTQTEPDDVQTDVYTTDTEPVIIVKARSSSPEPSKKSRRRGDVQPQARGLRSRRRVAERVSWRNSYALFDGEEPINFAQTVNHVSGSSTLAPSRPKRNASRIKPERDVEPPSFPHDNPSAPEVQSSSTTALKLVSRAPTTKGRNMRRLLTETEGTSEVDISQDKNRKRRHVEGDEIAPEQPIMDATEPTKWVEKSKKKKLEKDEKARRSVDWVISHHPPGQTKPKSSGNTTTNAVPATTGSPASTPKPTTPLTIRLPRLSDIKASNRAPAPSWTAASKSRTPSRSRGKQGKRVNTVPAEDKPGSPPPLSSSSTSPDVSDLS